MIDQLICGNRSSCSGRANDGFSPPRPSAVVLDRSVSSTRWIEPSGRVIGISSRSKRPAVCASSASRCERAAYSSRVARSRPPLRGDEFSRHALVDQSVRVPVRQRSHGGVLALRARSHRDPAHRLDAAGHDDVVRPRDDTLCGEVRGLLTAAALTVDGGARHGFGKPGSQCSGAGDVEGLLTGLRHAARDHVVDQRGVEIVASEKGAEGLGEKVCGVHAGECTARLAAPGSGADGVHDHCVDGHERNSLLVGAGLIDRQG